MSVLVSHPTGNANLRAVLRGLEHAGELSEFWTTMALPHNLTEGGWLSLSLQRRLSQRTFTEVPWSRTRIRPFLEVLRLGARSTGIAMLNQHETGWASVDAVYRDLDRAVSRHLRGKHCSARVVYAYEDGAFESFQAARATDRTCVYDLPIAYWRTLRRLLEEESERLPQWRGTMEGLLDSSEKYARKDAEIELSDQIVVASSFTRNSLLDHFGEIKVHVTPYGCPPPSVQPVSERTAGRPIELLFAGHLSQRKGIADLISAVRMLDHDWRLTLAGPRPVGAPRELDDFLADPRCKWLGTVPHATLLERMSQAHALIFPSIVEGFGMVITEAMACGLPVVTTPNTAGPDIVDEGQNGFIVPIRNPDALAERISWLANDEQLRLSMAHAAKRKAYNMRWTKYEEQITGLIASWENG